jgi:enediyne biosynthesis protein E4
LQVPMLAFNREGRFENGNPGTTTPVAGRGAAFGDINNDGWIDVLESILGGHPLLFRNRG